MSDETNWAIFGPPANREYMVYRCRGHYHLGLVTIDSDGNGDSWEMGTVADLKQAWIKWHDKLTSVRRDSA